MGRTANPQTGFGGLVRELRLKLELSQDEVAQQAGITGSYLARIELNKLVPNRSLVEQLAGVLGVPALSLMEAGGYVPQQIATAWTETPEPLLWFSSLPASARNRLMKEGTRSEDDDRKERARLRAIARRLADP